MREKLVVPAMLFLAASLPLTVSASTFDFSFIGPGVSGTIDLTYGTSTDSTYPDALQITGVSGIFTDTNNGLNLIDVALGSLVPVNFAAPDPTNLLAPNDFSKFAVANGLPTQSNGVLTYDNLYWPGGAPATASDYTAGGGFLDIYGLMFNIGNGEVVDVWSNGTFVPGGPIDYGVAVATAANTLDYVSGGVVITPEPRELGLLGVALLGIAVWHRRAAERKTA